MSSDCHLCVVHEHVVMKSKEVSKMKRRAEGMALWVKYVLCECKDQRFNL